MKHSGVLPWAYRRGKGLPYRMNALLKLALLFGLSFTVFIPSGWPFAAPLLSALLIAAFALSAGIRPWLLLRGSFPLLFICAITVLYGALRVALPPEGKFPFVSVDVSGLAGGLLFCAQMGVSFSAGALLFSVTTPGEIRKNLEKITGSRKPGLYIAVMLGFIPRFFECWENSQAAWESRGGRRGLKRLVMMVPLVCERMMEAAAETAAALESRGALLEEKK